MLNLSLLHTVPGQTQMLRISVHPPVVDGQEAQCQVDISGFPALPAIKGDDALQALENALLFVRSFLHQQPGTLQWEDGRPYADISAVS